MPALSHVAFFFSQEQSLHPLKDGRPLHRTVDDNHPYAPMRLLIRSGQPWLALHTENRCVYGTSLRVLQQWFGHQVVEIEINGELLEKKSDWSKVETEISNHFCATVPAHAAE